MLSGIKRIFARPTCAAAAAATLVLAAYGTTAKADETSANGDEATVKAGVNDMAVYAADDVKEKAGSAYSLSFGTTFTSHFVSFGVDVWGGGKDPSPFSARSTAWGYGTVTAKIDDTLSVYVNMWSDLNNNTTSGLGGPVQEIDVNTGLTLTFGDLSVGIVHGFWNYASDIEKVVDLTVSYNDADKIIKGFAFNPSVDFHYRYEGNGAQDTGGAAVVGIAPSMSLGEAPYAVQIAFPINCAFFTGGLQGGDGYFGYASAGVSGSVPLAFIPPKFGNWTASAGATFYHTEHGAIPGNPRSNFFVTGVSLGVAF